MDMYTDKHAQRMQNLVKALSQIIGLDEDRIQKLLLFARFHDIGKAEIPDYILHKPGSLTEDEFKIMMSHSKKGHDIANAIGGISEWILLHHEWWDGTGYPLGLKGEEIPLPCRIMAIVDSYDAITNERPYQKAKTHEEAVHELQRCAGTQFDPELVEKFIQLVNNLLAEEKSQVKKRNVV